MIANPKAQRIDAKEKVLSSASAGTASRAAAGPTKERRAQLGGTGSTGEGAPREAKGLLVSALEKRRHDGLVRSGGLFEQIKSKS